MSFTRIGLVLLAAALMLPAAQAHMTTTPDEDPAVLNPDASGTVGFTVSIACSSVPTSVADILAGEGSLTDTYTVAYPTGLTGTESVDISLDVTGCLEDPQGSVSDSYTLDVTVGAGAMGMVAQTIDMTAEDGDVISLPIQVGYRAGHNFVVDTAFPLEVGAEPVSWTGTLTVSANGDTMVMTQTTDKAEFGTVGGLFPFKNFFAPPAEGVTETITFTYTPSGGDWEEDSFGFTMWSHFIDDGNMKTPDETHEWTFVNTASTSSGGDSKDSPGIGAIAGIGLLGAVAALRRRS